jgi:Cu2+-exporting ATPase
LIRIAVAGALAGNVMLLAFALYGGHFHGIDDTYRRAFRWLSMLLTVPAVAWCALPFLRGAFGAFRTRTLHMDLPIAIGIAAGFIQGSLNTIFDRGEIYFESVTALIFFLLAGRFVQTSQQRAAANASELLFSLSPTTARRLADGAVEEVPVEALVSGDRVEVRSGETVPADGLVVDGRSNLDRSLLTGESRPEPIRPGSPIHAGTLNITAPIVLQVETTGEATRVGRLMGLVEESARRKAPTILLADRLSGWFVAAVVVLAAATFVYWLPRQPDEAVEHAVALLIVSCPCALGLATPLAVSAALAAAARRGLLVKNGEALEVLARQGIMVLDKTGTMTEGQMRLLSWYGEDELKPVVRAIEEGSNHPVAVALVEALPSRPGLKTHEVVTTSSGVTARVNHHAYAVGSLEFVRSATGRELPKTLEAVAEQAATAGSTPVVVAVDGRPAAVACLGDPLRGDAPDFIRQVDRLGWQPRLLSGDHAKVVATVADQAGIAQHRARGGVSPEGKVEAVRAALLEDQVVMVGDGVNDAAALAAATVGIGVHGGAEAALAAADIFVQRPGLAPLLELISGARRTVTVIRRNFAFSLTYNVIAAATAMSGHMSPILAAILMPLSSITVVVSSYRSKTF